MEILGKVYDRQDEKKIEPRSRESVDEDKPKRGAAF